MVPLLPRLGDGTRTPTLNPCPICPSSPSSCSIYPEVSLPQNILLLLLFLHSSSISIWETTDILFTAFSFNRGISIYKIYEFSIAESVKSYKTSFLWMMLTSFLNSCWPKIHLNNPIFLKQTTLMFCLEIIPRTIFIFYNENHSDLLQPHRVCLHKIK